MIRTATPADIPLLVVIGEAMHAESPRYRRLSYNPRKVGNLLARIVGHPDWLVLIAENGVLQGVAIACVDTEWFSDERIAQELVVYVRPDFRGSTVAPRLIIGLDAWAESKGAVYLQAGATTGVEPLRTTQLYEKLGFSACALGVERVYAKG